MVSEIEGTSMYEICKVGKARLTGEVIRIDHNRATIQVYEETGMQAVCLLHNRS